mmetsp:Transcript_38189/g.82733  ORF Transcript_38189/g.82733 Transcript_38189/m.82733 type:complete len:340 (+) Transcript_38189:539-1558(+)
MQGLHFFFGVGASISPGVVAALLAIRAEHAPQRDSYFVAAVLVVLLAVPALVVSSPQNSRTVSNSPKSKEPSTLSLRSIVGQIRALPRQRWAVILGVSAFLMFYVGVESSYGSFIYSFAVKEYNMNKTDAASLSSLVWFCMTLGRLLGVPGTLWLGDRYLALVCTLLGLLSNTALALINTPTAVWVTSVIFGVAMGPVFAAAFALPTTMGHTVTGRAASCQVMGASIGDMLVPVVLGVLFQTTSPLAIPIGCVICWGCCLALWVFVVVVAPLAFADPEQLGTAAQDDHIELLDAAGQVVGEVVDTDGDVVDGADDGREHDTRQTVPEENEVADTGASPA